MKPDLKALFVCILAAIVAVASLPIARSQAQDAAVTLTLAVPNFNRDVYTDTLIKDFESTHPAIKVQVVGQDARLPPPESDLTSYFDDLQKYIASADVLYVDSSVVSVEATRAGYFLDLAPLVSADNSLKADDFYPAIWNAYQWDNGTWVIPTSAAAYILTYKASAFDNVGLAYPSESWAVDDLMNAVDKLVEKDANGKITQKGLDMFGNQAQAALFRSLIGENLFDASQIPNQPQIDKPSVEAFLDAWNKRATEGSIGVGFNEAPMSISSANSMMRPGPNGTTTEQRKSILLPGGKAGLDVQGFAISKGTRYPDAAYALAAYLSTRAETRGGFGSASARQSLAGQTVSNGGPGGGGPGGGGPGGPGAATTPEQQAILDRAIANGLGASDLRFVNYLNTAIQKMQSESLDAKSALQAVEETVATNLKTATEKKDSLTINVATPIPDTVEPGKVVLKFGLQFGFGRQANQDKWDQVVAEFVANHPDVARVSIDEPTPQTQADSMASKYDCFYLGNNAVQDINVKSLLNLDPYLSSDPSFDKSDMVGSVMDMVTRDNKVWARPISISPSILKYDVNRFGKAGIPLPTTGWTIDAFVDAIKQLKPTANDDPPFIPQGTGGTHLLILIASYGGLPIDFRTDPPTFRYTDPATVDAIRQVLDLAKNGYIQYTQTGTAGFGFDSGATDPSIYTASLNAFNFRPGGPNASTAKTYNSVSYPRGKTLNGVSYSIGTAYISAATQNADACYQWISTLAQNPDLFSAMPAQRSRIDSSTQGDDARALYHQIADLLADPTTVSFPSLQGARQSMFYQMWLFQAFDTYVLKNGDLDAALKDAQDKSTAFAECVAKIPPYDASSTNANDYFRQYGACAGKADPALSSMFN